MRRHRLIITSAVMATAATLAVISPAMAQASTATTQVSQVSTAATSPAVSDIAIIEYIGQYDTNAECAAAGARYVDNGAYSFWCDKSGSKWDLYVEYVIV
jgi:uncharacterized protein YggE